MPVTRRRSRKTIAGLLTALFAVLGATGVTRRAGAQDAGEAAKFAENLPQTSKDVIARLTDIRELPDGQWKTHSGDLAHGEAVDLDESGWTPIAPKSKSPNESAWFRQTYEVPQTLHGYDLTGVRIWFQFHASANGPMPEIIYFNGRRVALGDDLEPIILFDNAKAGDKVTVAVKLMLTVDQKTIDGATLKIDFPANRPSPEDLREEFLSAALLVPTLLANDASEMNALNGAIGAVDVKALDAQDQNKFDASLREAHSRLEALLPVVQQATYHLTGNSHIDAAWLWPWTETVDVVKRTFATALQLMDEYPQYTYTQSAAAYNEWVAQKYPWMNDEIKRRIREGRWEVVGGMWVEPDLNVPDGESLVRQLLVGKRWFKKEYGVDVHIGWNPDSFGYTWQLPQIYKKSGVDYFVTQKMAWNDTNQLPFKYFYWESPDGSKVLAYFPHDYANNNLNAVRLARDFAIAHNQAPGLPAIMDLYGIGDHGGGATRAILDEGMHWAGPGTNGTNHVTPKFEFGLAQPYFDELSGKIASDSPVWDYRSIAKGYTPPPAVPGKVAIPTWKSEMFFEYHRGVMTTQANHKRNMRDSEEQVLNAEKWASLAWLDGCKYPANEITEDWKKVLFNQFHDLAAGSGIGIIYKDAQKDYDVVRYSTNEISAASLQTLDERVNTAGSGVPVVVYNPLGWERSGEVTAHVQGPKGALSASGAQIVETKTDEKTGVADVRLHVLHVPALGYKVVWIGGGAHGKQAADNDVSANESGNSVTLENSTLRVSVDKQSGCITSLFQKKSNFETLAPGACGNQLQFFKDTPKDYDAWNVDPGTLDVPPETIDHADSVELVKTAEPGIRVTFHRPDSKFVQTLSLNAEGDMVDVDNQVDWHESHIFVKAAFPLAATGP